jgi:hypothetical protein
MACSFARRFWFFPHNIWRFTHFLSKLDEGTLTTRTYRGEMRNNERHGLGALLDADGSVLKYELEALLAHVTLALHYCLL